MQFPRILLLLPLPQFTCRFNAMTFAAKRLQVAPAAL
jgi:hypothetical protein